MDKAMKIAVTLSAYDKMSTVVNTAVDKVQRKIKGMREGLNSFGDKSMIAGGIGIGLFAGALKSAAAMEKMQVSLNTSFQGNEAAAKKAFDTINVFAAKTPYGLEEVMTGFIKLKNMGLDPSEEALQAYGNTASSMGKSLDQMVEAVADAATGEFERLKEFGIKASSQKDKVTFTFQGVKTTVQKNSAAIEGYLKKIGNTKFAGGIAAQSKTIDGQMSTLKDNFTMVSASIGKLFIPTVNRLFRSITPIIEKVQLWVTENPGLIKGIAAATIVLFSLGVAAKSVAFAMGGISPIMKATMVVMNMYSKDAKVAAAASKIFRAALMSTGIVLIIAAIAAAVYLIYKNWDGIKAWFISLWDKVTAIFSSTWNWIKNMFLNYTPAGLIIKHWAFISHFFGQLWRAVKIVFTVFWQWAKGLFMKYTPAGLIVQHWDKISGFFSSLWTKVKEVFSKFWEGLKTFLLNYTPQGLIYKHWDETVNYFSNIWDKVTKIFSNAWKSIKNGLKSFFGAGGDVDKALDRAEQAANGTSNINVNTGGPKSPGLRPNPVSTSAVHYSPTVVLNGAATPADAANFISMTRTDAVKIMQEAQQKKARVAF